MVSEEVYKMKYSMKYKMKYSMKKILFIGFIFALIFALTSCSGIVKTEQGDVIKTQCEEFLDCIISGDSEKAFSVITEGANKESFLESFSIIKEKTFLIKTATPLIKK